MSRHPEYNLYATLLDSFSGYLNSDVIYQKYWGWSENPPHTEEEFRELQFRELINRINRVPFDSEKADRGTVFNEIIDCMVENRKSDTVSIEKIKNDSGQLIALCGSYNNRVFTFPISLCREFAEYFKGALTQQRVEAVLPTLYGDVLVYGIIDELMPASIHDIKTTESYSAFKFRNNFQHLVYPYCLMQNGSDVRLFEYNVVEFNKNTGCPAGTFTETYVFNPGRDIPILTEHCEHFIQFLEENRNRITDKKIFADDL
jgi:hypothetical protein